MELRAKVTMRWYNSSPFLWMKNKQHKAKICVSYSPWFRSRMLEGGDVVDSEVLVCSESTKVKGSTRPQQPGSEKGKKVVQKKNQSKSFSQKVNCC